jgi:hypothetical protein
MTLDIAIDADAEWDSSNDWARLARSAAAAAIAESAFPQLGQGEPWWSFPSVWPATNKSMP